MMNAPSLASYKRRIKKIRSFVVRFFLYHHKLVYIRILNALIINEKRNGTLKKKLRSFRESKQRSFYNKAHFFKLSREKRLILQQSELMSIVNGGLKDAIKRALFLNKFILEDDETSSNVDVWQEKAMFKTLFWVKSKSSFDFHYRFPIQAFNKVKSVFLRKIHLGIMGLIMKNGPFPLLQHHAAGTTLLLSGDKENGTSSIVMRDLLTVLNYAKSTYNIIRKSKEEKKATTRLKTFLKKSSVAGSPQNGFGLKRPLINKEIKEEREEEDNENESVVIEEVEVQRERGHFRRKRKPINQRTQILNEMNLKLGLVPDTFRFNYLSTRDFGRQSKTKTFIMENMNNLNKWHIPSEDKIRRNPIRKFPSFKKVDFSSSHQEYSL